MTKAKSIRLYAVKYRGKLLDQTVADSKSDCWFNAFPFIDHVYDDGVAFWQKYWKRLGPSKVAASKLGYKIVPCRLIEE